MDDFYAATFTGRPSVARNEHRIVGVTWNKTVYESQPDSIYWREIAVLPKDVEGGSIVSIELSPANEIFIQTSRALYMLDEQKGSWVRMTEHLQIPSDKYLGDFAINRDGIIVMMTELGREIYRTTNRGASWQTNDTKSALPVFNNPLQYSEAGVLYINSFDGLYRSYNDGVTTQHVDLSNWWLRFDSFASPNAIIIRDDCDIWGCTRDGDVYHLDCSSNQWKLFREADWRHEYYPRIAFGDDGTMFYSYYHNSMSMSIPNRKAIDWSTDGGASWSTRFIEFTEMNSEDHCSEILFGNADKVFYYEHIGIGGDVYEVFLNESRVYQRTKPIAQGYANYITGNSNELWTISISFSYHYDKASASVFPMTGFGPYTGRYNYILRDNGVSYEISGKGVKDEYGNLMGSNISRRVGRHGAHDYLFGAVAFVVLGNGDIIYARRLGNGASRCDSIASWYIRISEMYSEYVSRNVDDYYLIANRRGEFEYYSPENTLIAKGQLQAFGDSIHSVQNDRASNFVFVGKRAVYASTDYGTTWAQSSVDNDNALMYKVIVDHKNCFYVMDWANGVYWSWDKGRSFERLPISFDSLYCQVTDIYVDQEYLYCSTSGCGVYRMALPSLNGLDSPRPVAQLHAPINLYSGNRRHVAIEVPFSLDGSTLFRLSDLNGRIIYESEYTVNIPRSEITLNTKTFPNGVYPFMISSLKEAVSGKLMIQR